MGFMNTKLFHTKGIWQFLSTRPEIDAIKIDYTSITFYSKGKEILNILDDTGFTSRKKSSLQTMMESDIL